MNQKIYEAIHNEIQSGETDYQTIAQNVADKLNLDKNELNWNYILAELKRYNDNNEVEF